MMTTRCGGLRNLIRSCRTIRLPPFYIYCKVDYKFIICSQYKILVLITIQFVNTIGLRGVFELTCTAKLVVQICTETLLNSLNIIIISLLPLN